MLIRLRRHLPALVLVLALACDRQPETGVQFELPPGSTSTGSHGVVFVEFGSYMCSVCRTFTRRIMPQLDSVYFQSGRAVFRYVDMDTVRRFRLVAALTDCAAARVGALRAMQYAFESGVNRVPADSVVGHFAGGLHLDTDSLRSCTMSEFASRERAQQQSAGRGLQVKATPTFVVGFINSSGTVTGWPVVGIVSVDSMRYLLDAAERAYARTEGQ
jgi:protein-disulfide isomerase